MKKRIKKVVHHLRSRPEEERRHILHIFTFVGAVFMIVLWTFTLGQTLGGEDIKTQMKEDIKPFSNLKNNLTDSFNELEDESETKENNQYNLNQ